MAEADIPILVKHVALAVYKSGDLKGNKFQKVLAAFDIARSRLVEYGFLTKTSNLGGPDNIKLTGKGHKREAYHRHEGGLGKVKTRHWDDLYALIQEAVEEQPGDGEMDEGATPVSSPRDARAQATKMRLAKAAQSAPKSPKRRTKKRRVTKAKKARRG